MYLNNTPLERKININKVLIFGTIVYTMQLVFAGVFYKERTIFTDIAFHLFQIIKNENFAIQNNRFGAVCTQIFPLIALKFDLSLQQISFIYSQAFIIFYFLVFIVILKCFHTKRIALAWLGFNTIMVTHTFYWIQSELSQGMSFAFLYFALLDNILKKESIPNYFFTLVFIFLVIVCFTHPLLVFAEIFVLLFFILKYNHQKKIIFWNIWLVLGLYIIKSAFFKTKYDAVAMSGLKNIWLLFPNYFTLTSNANFFKYLLHDYYFLLFLSVFMFAFYIRKKQYKKLILVGCFFFGYLFIVNISYPNGTHQYYIENQYLILSVFVLIPFLFDVFPNINYKNQLIGILFVSFISLIRIYNGHELYTTRLNWNRQFLAKISALENKKLIVNKENVPMDTLLANWSSSFEFWLLSTIENDTSRSIIIIDNKDEITWQKGYNKIFVTKWDTPEYSTLNKKYFIFNDTSYYCDYEYKE